MFKLTFLFGFLAINLSDALQVITLDGAVEGASKTTYAGNTYYAFYSIPYAQPPTGSLRFQAPVAVQPWSGVHDATKEGNICYQVNVDSADENEDCLTLNVYTPKDPSQNSTKLPVLFYIHGGGFSWGSGQTKGATGGIEPGFFMDDNIVMVSVNYRLGPFGFFATGDSIIPGNAGLKDQTLALQWVQKNIEVFGGDPKKVTIFGESAGGASVGYHIVSPLSNGLFSGGIVASGTSLCPWAYQRNQTEITFKTASFIDSQFDTNRDSKALFTFLQTANAKDIDTASKKYSDWAQSYNDTGLNGVINGQLQQGFFYAPVVEPENTGAFITETPYEIFAGGTFNKVPILIGACADEGLISYNENLQWILSVYDSDHSILVPQNMHISDSATKQTVGDAIKNEYSPSDDMQYNLVSGIKYFTDHVFQRSLIRHAELQSKFTDVYFYKFSYSGQMGGNTNNVYPGTSNVTHVEEGNYIWQRANPTSFPQTDQLVHQRLMKIWINFITSYNPTPSADPVLQNVVWPTLKESSLKYVDITSNLTVSTDPLSTYSFWKGLYEKYGVEPFDTY
ncbi:hypothetical protein ABEB36_005649 [Hypothenemus hampei]|uniref:Carboxylic ester hydrolase n=1 Tax=Hypothenemus hampei TaxID=57062 RepID=A0ABD1EZ26_HYPHA